MDTQRLTLPETNSLPLKIGHHESSNHRFSGDMLVLGSVGSSFLGMILSPRIPMIPIKKEGGILP